MAARKSDAAGLSHTNIERARAFFEPRPAQHGDSHLAVDWGSRQGQYARFDALRRLAPLQDRSLLDVGCGLGHLLDWLSEQQINPDFYEGIDVTHSMVTAARLRHPEALFHVCDLLAGERPSRKSYDVVFASGIFYLALDDPYAYIAKLLKQLYSLAAQAVVFNLLTQSRDDQASEEFCGETGKILEIVSSLSSYFRADHSYHSTDISIAVYRQIAR